MAKSKLLNDFLKYALTEQENKQIKGGKSYVPGNSGSYGYINWDDVIIRDGGLISPNNDNKLSNEHPPKLFKR